MYVSAMPEKDIRFRIKIRCFVVANIRLNRYYCEHEVTSLDIEVRNRN